MNNEMLVLCAFRYTLYRQSYIVGMMCDYLNNAWEEIPERLKNIILREIKEALPEDIEQEWRILYEEKTS